MNFKKAKILLMSTMIMTANMSLVTNASVEGTMVQQDVKSQEEVGQISVIGDAEENNVQQSIEIETKENEQAVEEYIGELVPFSLSARGSSKPGKNSVKNLSNGIKYTFDFTAWSGTGVFSAYNFTGVSKMRLFIDAVSRDNAHKSFDYTVKIYKRGKVIDDCIATYTRNIKKDEKTVMVFNTNTNSKYYFKIVTPYGMEGSGYIKKY